MKLGIVSRIPFMNQLDLGKTNQNKWVYIRGDIHHSYDLYMRVANNARKIP